jgi:septal ring factor EnvC (AmiA/AmiB activator)
MVNEQKIIEEVYSRVTADMSDVMGQFMEVISDKFDKIDQRFDAMDQRFDAMDQRFDAQDQEMKSINSRLKALESSNYEIKQMLKKLDDRVETLENDVNAIYLMLADIIEADKKSATKLKILEAMMTKTVPFINKMAEELDYPKRLQVI